MIGRGGRATVNRKVNRDFLLEEMVDWNSGSLKRTVGMLKQLGHYVTSSKHQKPPRVQISHLFESSH